MLKVPVVINAVNELLGEYFFPISAVGILTLACVRHHE